MYCIVTINVLWLFLTMPYVGLQCMIVVFPDHTHLLFAPSTDPDKMQHNAAFYQDQNCL